MSIFDDTGQSPSITEGPRSLRLFIDRYHLIRAFTRALHEDDALGKILYLRGGGGNGKSLLVRFLQRYACKRFFDWDGLTRQSDAEFVRRLQQNDPSYQTTFQPLPVAYVDFHAPPREFEQPTVDYDALLMLRRQLGTFRAESFAPLRFPVYDFAAVWYLHQTGRLTEARLSSLFPREEINFVIALAEIIKERPVVKVAQAVLEMFDQRIGEWWTLFRHRRTVDPSVIEEIQAMDPERDLIPDMPRLFARDLNAARAIPGAPPRIILLADGHEVFTGLNGDSGIEGDRDGWLRYLLGELHLQAGIVPVITSRQELDWANRARYAIPTGYLDSRTVDHFSDADAATYLAKAGVDDSGLRARLCDYARIAPDEIHPLYAGLGADIVLQAIQQGHRLTVEDFPDRLPDAQSKPRLLVERLLREASRDVGYAVRSLAAARAFDRELFEKLGSGERSRYSATDAAFDTLTLFSFVWEAQSRESGWYSIHTLLRRIFRERGDERLREADAVLEAVYRERTEAGDTLALAEVAYHAYQLEPERGLHVWADAFEEARKRSQYALCEALRTVSAEIKTEEPGWRARIAREEGEYLLARSRYAEAEKVLRASVSASDEAIERAPDEPYAYSNKGVALRSLGNLLAGLSRHEEAEGAYGNAVAAFDAELSRAPGDPIVHNNKGNALSALGGLLAGLSRYEEAERLHNDAIAAVDEAISRAPDDPRYHSNKGDALRARGDLLALLSRYEEAEAALVRAIAAMDETISRAPNNAHAYRTKAIALQSYGDLLARLSRPEDAEDAYTDAVVALDEAISLAPGFTFAYISKGIVLQRHGLLLAHLSRNEDAERILSGAIAALDEALSRSPDDFYAHFNKGDALQSLGGLLGSLSCYEEAEKVYGEAVAVLDETISLAPSFTYAYFKKGNALSAQGDMLASISRFEHAQRTFSDAVAAYDEELNRVPDNVGVHLMKALALVNQGRLLRILDSEKRDVRARWEAAQSHAEHAITLKPHYEQARSLLAEIRDLLDSLDDSP